MGVSSINSAFGLGKSIADARVTLGDLQRQLASQKLSTSYGGLGANRTQVLSFRGELSQLEGYRSTAANIGTRLEAVQLTLNQIRELTVETRSDASSNDYSFDDGGQTSFQALTKGRFLDITSMLNLSIGDKHVFGGRVTEAPPLPPGQEILEGDGDLAGFEQIVDERRQADIGLNGLGRLSISSSGGATASLSEDAAGHPFGFKIAGVSANTLGANITGPTGSPVNVDFTFASQPNNGSSVVITLDLPDGNQTSIKVSASSGVATQPGEFQIGATEQETADNFSVALNAAIRDAGQTDLRAASLYVSADNFFDVTDTNVPQRIVGPPFESATTLVDATAADTVIYYQGEISATSARDSAVSKVDDSIIVSHGVRANEDAFRTVLKNLAMLAVETFDASNENDVERYEALRLHVSEELSFGDGAQSVQNVVTEIVVAQTSIGNADERHEAKEFLLEGLIFDVENADIYEVSAQILALKTRVEASLAVTATLSKLSILQFL